MALTDENSVLILGAGASAPFGVPVGSALIDTIARNLSKQLKWVDSANPRLGYSFSVSHRSSHKDDKLFKEFPYLQPLIRMIKDHDTDLRDVSSILDLTEQIEWQCQVMKQLRDRLYNQTSDSIDDFIVMNEHYADHVKICIAAEFIQALYNDQNLVGLDARYLSLPKNYLRPGGEIQKHKERNWIHRLINLIRLGVQEGWVTEDNKVKIITFNYDTILEYVLEQQFSNTEVLNNQGVRYQDYIDIIHVHGQCGKLEKTMSGNPSKTCWEWAQGIHVIREDEGNLPPKVKKERKRAEEWIKSATEIYAAGFAFAKANTDLIGLKEGSPKNIDGRRVINYCNFGDDIGLRNAAEKFKYRYKNRQGVESDHAYTKVFEQKKLGVSDWIGVGTLGELP